MSFSCLNTIISLSQTLEYTLDSLTHILHLAKNSEAEQHSVGSHSLFLQVEPSCQTSTAET